MRGNGGGKCFGTVAISLCGGMKGGYMHLSTPTLKSVMKMRKSV